jgi:hypothetical protein
MNDDDAAVLIDGNKGHNWLLSRMMSLLHLRSVVFDKCAIQRLLYRTRMLTLICSARVGINIRHLSELSANLRGSLLSQELINHSSLSMSML